MARPVVLGIDCSTTGARCVAWDAQGRAVAEGRSSIPLVSLPPEGYEQDAERWWSAVVEATASVTAALGRARVEGLCVAHQRETFVVADADGRPRRPGVVWMDERCRPQVARVKADPALCARLHDTTGKPPCLTPSLYKIMYLREVEGSTFEGDFIVADVHAFLARRLTGLWRTSTASADPTGLVDMRSGRWSAEALGLAGLSERHLPELLPPGALLGALSPEAARAMGLSEGLPVIAGAGDGQAAGLGAGICGPGRAYLNLGTAVVSGVWSPAYRVDPAFRTLFGAAPGSYFCETDLKGGTFTLNWLLDHFMGVEPAGRDEALAALEVTASAMAPGSSGLIALPYWCGVMNPHWDDDASGALLGLRGHHGPAHVYRAILEGIAMEQRLHTDGVERAVNFSVEDFVVMGGGARSDLWCQIVADATGRRVVRAANAEATALGAGVLAAVGVGMHADVDAAVAAMISYGEVFAPGGNAARYADLYDEVYAGVYGALQGALSRLTRFLSP